MRIVWWLVIAACALGLATGPRTTGLLLNTLCLAAATCAICVPLGTLLALAITKTNVAGRRTAAALLVVMLLLPLFLHAAGWRAGFGLQGWYSVALDRPALLEGWRAAIWIHAMASTVWVVLIVGAGLQAVEPELEEAALIDGTQLQVLLNVTLRRALGPIVLATMWVAAITMSEMTVTDLEQIRTFAEEIYSYYNIGGWDTNEDPLELQFVAALTMFVVGLAALTAAELSNSLRQVSLRARWRWEMSGGLRWGASLATWLLVALVAIVPLANLGLKAGLVIRPGESGPLRYWSAQKFVSMVAESPVVHANEFRWSLMIAAAAATAAVAVALPLAWLAIGGRWRTIPAVAVLAVGIATPGPVLGMFLIWLVNRPAIPLAVKLYDYTIFAPWLAQTVRALPLAIAVLWLALATVPKTALESAATEGAGSLAQLVRIAIPARRTALLVAWLGSGIVALGELSATLIVAPPGIQTLPMRIYALLHFGVDDQVAGICLALVLLLSTAICIALGVLRLATRRPR